MSAWKTHERRTAKTLGGVRTGPTGRNTNDVEHGWLAVECKHRKSLPDWLMGAMRQAKANSNKGEKLPVVVLHQLGQRHADDLVVMRMADFKDYFGDELKGDDDESSNGVA